MYFDFEKWGQRKKEGFTFEYRFLEDRDLDWIMTIKNKQQQIIINIRACEKQNKQTENEPTNNWNNSNNLRRGDLISAIVA